VTGVDWSATPSVLFTNDNGSGTTFSTAWDQVDRGPGTITATLYSNCDTFNITKKVHAGPPSVPEDLQIVGEYCGHPSPFPCIYYYGERYGVKLDSYMEGATQGYEWSGMAQDIHSYCGSTGASFIPNNLGPPHYGSGYIQVVGKNQCGDSYPVQTGYGPCQRATSSGKYYILSPNPADESTEVSTKESTETQTQEGTTTETFEPGQIKIYDKSGIVVRAIEYKSPRQRINTSSMDEGIYIVEISTPKHTEKLRLMVEH
jgi:hypothetical protein